MIHSDGNAQGAEQDGCLHGETRWVSHGSRRAGHSTPGAPASQRKTRDSKAAGGLDCPGGAGITQGLGSSGSSLRCFLSWLFMGVTTENKSCAVPKGILITFLK